MLPAAISPPGITPFPFPSSNLVLSRRVLSAALRVNNGPSVGVRVWSWLFHSLEWCSFCRDLHSTNVLSRMFSDPVCSEGFESWPDTRCVQPHGLSLMSRELNLSRVAFYRVLLRAHSFMFTYVLFGLQTFQWCILQKTDVHSLCARSQYDFHLLTSWIFQFTCVPSLYDTWTLISLYLFPIKCLNPAQDRCGLETCTATLKNHWSFLVLTRVWCALISLLVVYVKTNCFGLSSFQTSLSLS